MLARSVLPCFAVVLLSFATAAVADDAPQFVDVDGQRLHVNITTSGDAHAPTVVFVTGLGTPLRSWSEVQPRVAAFARTLAYDRAGIGDSPAERAEPTPRHVATQLHALLAAAHLPPPYLLVGHSLGGAFIRMFAALYPAEVTALVYVDPVDFTQTRAEQLALWKTLGSGAKGLAQFETITSAWYASRGETYRRESAMAVALDRDSWREFRQLPAVGNVPIIVLLSTRYDAPPPNVKLAWDDAAFARLRFAQRIEHFGRLVREAADGMLITTSRSGHSIQLGEPELVVAAIRRALTPAPTR